MIYIYIITPTGLRNPPDPDLKIHPEKEKKKERRKKKEYSFARDKFYVILKNDERHVRARHRPLVELFFFASRIGARSWES